MKRVENPVDFGIVITRDDGTIERFLEKPTWGEVFSDTINTNIYVLEPEIFDYIPEGEVVDFSGDVFPEVLAQGKKLVGHVIDGYWEDVGTLEAYRRAHEDILDGRMHLEMPGFEVREGVWLGEGADLSPDAEVYGPVLIGDNSRVEAGAVLRPYTVIGTDVVVKADAELERSVVHDHVYIGPGARLRGSVVGRASDIRDGARVEENVVIGDECFVGEHAIINPSVKIYPFKMVEPGALVTSSIVWESKGARTLFGRRGVRGLANVDITSEVAVRLAMAYGTALKKGAVVCTSRDTSRSARALKRALIAGLNLSGVHVMDLELSTVPLTRFQVRHPGCAGRDQCAPRVGRCRQRRDPVHGRVRRRHRRGRAAQDRAAALPRGLPPRVRGRHRRHRVPARERSSSTRPRSRRACSRSGSAAGRSRSCSTTPSAPRRSSCRTCWPSSGASVLAVNPFAATSGAMGTSDDHESRVKNIGDLVRTSGSDLGYVFDPDGETATIIDDQGVPLSAEHALLALVKLVCEQRPGARLALPVSVSMEAERLGQQQRRADHVDEALGRASHGGRRERRRSTSPLRRRAGSSGPRSCPRTTRSPRSCTCSTCSRRVGVRCRRSSPRSPRRTSRTTPCPTPWERKGTVMRGVMERAKDFPTVLVDGVKIVYPEGWALVLPDPELAITHIWAEGASDVDARRLVAIHAGQVAELTR